MTDQAECNLTELTVNLLAAFVSNNSIGAKDFPDLIASTHAALAALDNKPSTKPEPPAEPEQEWTPAVSARKSLAKREHILSMP